ncbi:hypothetical protein CH373_09630 [Leptospira perolatii]|uniref:DUF4349 domain-containing protein n=1 Tax=Leptospira perolatii TaxID=2023191 RepID=A0A2M9ZMH6_9LEPT|nr:DUF4349 domain-containing protein [Leptospira perolatii]PJZ70049.1 hypothetical protein CH360_07375 [Leptospira perolatii]PJZ73237.1 hypothetical protein CH373_09630 [Leptospira perolatii]
MTKEEILSFLKKFGIIFAILFGVLFLLRLLYAYVVEDTVQRREPVQYHNQIQTQTETSVSGGEFSYSRKNYASEKLSTGKSIDAQSSQKYEKIANISSRSGDFEEDEKKARKTVQDFKAIIQYELSSGLPGNRVVQLGIGVPPEKFDSMVEAIRAIGKIQSISVHKTDKTNEYMDITAKRLSLEKSQKGLLSLKGRGGKIDELITLEKEILETEKNIQDLGVKLGEFDSENEFCTIKFSMSESDYSPSFIYSLLKKVKISLEWTIEYSLMFTFVYLFACAGALISWFFFKKFIQFLKDQEILK